MKRINADRIELALRGFVTESLDVSDSGIGLEQRVVNQTGDIIHALPADIAGNGCLA